MTKATKQQQKQTILSMCNFWGRLVLLNDHLPSEANSLHYGNVYLFCLIFELKTTGGKF